MKLTDIYCLIVAIYLVGTLQIAAQPLNIDLAHQPKSEAIDPQLQRLMDAADDYSKFFWGEIYFLPDFILADAKMHLAAGDLAGTRKMLRKITDAVPLKDKLATSTDHFIRAEKLISAMELMARAEDFASISPLIPDAMVAAKGIDSPYHWPRFLGRIAALQNRVGDATYLKTVESAFAEPMAGSDAEIVEAFARLGNFVVARRLGQQISGSAGLERVAAAQAEQGDIAGAESTMHLIEPYESGAMAAIAEAQDRRGDFAGAMKTMLRKPAGQLSPRAQSILAKLLAKTESIGEALKLAATIENPRFQIDAYLNIAAGQLKQNDRPAAQRTVQTAYDIALQFDDDTWMYRNRSPALGKVAVAFMHAGDAVTARCCVIKARYSNLDRSEGRLDLVRQLADGGMIQEAKSVAETVIDDAWSEQPAACQAIARAMMRDPTIVDAEQWADHLTSPRNRAFARIGIAEGLIERRKHGVHP